ncbi:MAG: nitroreductase family protein [Methanomassiliicoccales archaeon]|jgi:nitroreductase
MEKMDLYDAIFKRKSIRKFEAVPLDAGTLAKVSSFLGTVKPMYPEIKTELKLLSNMEVKAGLMKAKSPHFVAAFSEKKENSLVNAGFMLQQVDLFLSANGIGSVWQGNPKPSSEASSGTDLEFVIMMAFGKPAEPLHRTDVSEFKREPLTEVGKTKGFEEILEPARLAPSAMNLQPWYFVGGEGAVHFYLVNSAMFDKWNKVSVGAAICHAWLAANHLGKSVEFVGDEKASEDATKKRTYVATMRIGTKPTQIINAPESDVSYSFEVQVDNSAVRSP